MEHNRSYLLSAALLAVTGLALLIYAVYANMNASVIISWETATEFETAGYAIYRSDSPDGPFVKVSPDLIPASTDPLTGGVYDYQDDNVRAGQTYYYQLEEIETTGATSVEGPVEVTAAYRGVAESILGLVLLVFAWYTYRLAARRPAEFPNE